MNRNTRTLIVVLIAVACAGAATYLVYRAILQRPVQEVQIPQVQVVVAARSLQTGAQLTAGDVKLIGWPGDAVVPGAFNRVEDVINRGVLTEVVENEPLTASKLAAPGAGAGLPPVITPGMRAISVRVNEVVGVAGFVTPGNRVDVFVTLKQGDSTLTKVVLSNVQVLTAGTKYEQDKSRSGEAIPSTVVTLLLTPEDAERVVREQFLAMFPAEDRELHLQPAGPTVIPPRRSARARSGTAPVSGAAISSISTGPE